MHSRKTTFIAAALLFVCFCLPQRAWCSTTPPAEQVKVVKVDDGDTIVVDRNGRETTIRLIGVDTPEVAKPDTQVQFYGPEASEFTRRMLLGRMVKLEFESRNRPGGSIDRYGRTLAYVITDDGRNFCRELVRLGYGRVYDRFPFRYLEDFRKAEKEARALELGIWSDAKRAAWSNPHTRGKVIGNIKSHIYHLPGQYAYNKINDKNRVYFQTEQEAMKAGYRKANK